MGRPRKPQGQKQSIRVVLYLTPAEKKHSMRWLVRLGYRSRPWHACGR